MANKKSIESLFYCDYENISKENLLNCKRDIHQLFYDIYELDIISAATSIPCDSAYPVLDVITKPAPEIGRECYKLTIYLKFPTGIQEKQIPFGFMFLTNAVSKDSYSEAEFVRILLKKHIENARIAWTTLFIRRDNEIKPTIIEIILNIPSHKLQIRKTSYIKRDNDDIFRSENDCDLETSWHQLKRNYYEIRNS